MKLRGCGYIAPHLDYKAVQNAGGDTTQNNLGEASAVVDVAPLTESYSLFPVWGGIILRHGTEFISLGGFMLSLC